MPRRLIFIDLAPLTRGIWARWIKCRQTFGIAVGRRAYVLKRLQLFGGGNLLLLLAVHGGWSD